MAVLIHVAMSLEPEVSYSVVNRGVMPFYAAVIVLVVLLMFFPQLALWIPSHMTG